MVRLRLRRKGRAHLPVYDIIAVDQRKPRDGAFLEIIGFFDPNTQPNTIRIDAERSIYWLNVGAQPSETVRNLMSYEGVLLRRHLMFKGKSQTEIDEEIEKHKQIVADRYARRAELRKKRKIAKIKAAEDAEKAEAEAAAAPAEEAPAEEAPAE